MAIIKDGIRTYEGAVLREEEHSWMDGMLSVYAVVWDMDTHSEQRIQVGYYGSDGCNLCGAYDIELGVSTEVARDILRTNKQRAIKAFCNSVINKKTAIEKGITAEVTRGKKVPVGTKLNVFWVGEKPTYRSRQCPWMNETEMIAGGHDEDGKLVWIKAEYLKNITPLKSPVAAEREKFIKSYIKRNVSRYIFEAARA